MKHCFPSIVSQETKSYKHAVDNQKSSVCVDFGGYQQKKRLFSTVFGLVLNKMVIFRCFFNIDKAFRLGNKKKSENDV